MCVTAITSEQITYLNDVAGAYRGVVAMGAYVDVDDDDDAAMRRSFIDDVDGFVDIGFSNINAVLAVRLFVAAARALVVGNSDGLFQRTEFQLER